MTLGRPFCFSGSGGFSKLQMRRRYSRQGEILKLKRASPPVHMCADKLAEDGVGEGHGGVARRLRR